MNEEQQLSTMLWMPCFFHWWRSLVGQIRAIVTIWSDSILCRAAGWLNIPDETTLGRLFRTFSHRHITEMEVLNHHLRGKVWRKALRTGTSRVSVDPCKIIDMDATEKTDARNVIISHWLILCSISSNPTI